MLRGPEWRLSRPQAEWISHRGITKQSPEILRLVLLLGQCIAPLNDSSRRQTAGDYEELRLRPPTMKWRFDITFWLMVSVYQESDRLALEERGKQVALMYEIYSKADKVKVYLGEVDAASDVACQTIEGLFAQYALAAVPGPLRASARAKDEKLAQDAISRLSPGIRN